MLTVIEARFPEDMDAARALIRGFMAWAREAFAPDTHLVDRYFAGPAFEAELDGLPGRYAPPAGRLLVARRGPEAAGVVALRDLGGGTCEMKRMFVLDRERGSGVGRLLVDRLIEEGRAAGYARMRLDTSHHQHAAQRLYERAGFRPIPPYYDPPEELRDWLRYYERDLAE
ncbi:MAG TPA: GNAT family N-acetyltransferase [Rubellimicrobium sp.]|nr:GNAT family N-acetyltransferase [Rubellimicrobium sp.]